MIKRIGLVVVFALGLTASLSASAFTNFAEKTCVKYPHVNGEISSLRKMNYLKSPDFVCGEILAAGSRLVEFYNLISADPQATIDDLSCLNRFHTEVRMSYFKIVIQTYCADTVAKHIKTQGSATVGDQWFQERILGLQFAQENFDLKID